MIAYGKSDIDDTDIEAVTRALRSAWLTTGPLVGEFESAFAKVTGTTEAVAFSNGTAALHGAMHAYGVGAGDEVIVAANTFVASANCIVYQGGKPVFVDVDEETLLIDPADVAKKVTSRTRGIIAVDYAGQPCDYEELTVLARRRGLFLHADACHSLGAACKGKPVGSLADSSSFSFHPVKPITTAEGGMVTTNDAGFAARLRVFRSHGISGDYRSRDAAVTWEYDMAELGWNYRLPDVLCALGLSQLARLPEFIQRRNEVADYYDHELKDVAWLEAPRRRAGASHAFHLYVTRIHSDFHSSQREIFETLRGRGIGVHVMYRPVYEHSYYRETLGYGTGLCPRAEAAYRKILILPVHMGLTNDDCRKVVDEIRRLGI